MSRRHVRSCIEALEDRWFLSVAKAASTPPAATGTPTISSAQSQPKPPPAPQGTALSAPTGEDAADRGDGGDDQGDGERAAIARPPAPAADSADPSTTESRVTSTVSDGPATDVIPPAPATATPVRQLLPSVNPVLQVAPAEPVLRPPTAIPLSASGAEPPREDLLATVRPTLSVSAAQAAMAAIPMVNLEAPATPFAAAAPPLLNQVPRAVQTVALAALRDLGQIDSMAAFAGAVSGFCQDLAFVGASVLSPQTDAATPTDRAHARAWAITLAVAGFDAVLLTRWYMVRRRDQASRPRFSTRRI